MASRYVQRIAQSARTCTVAHNRPRHSTSERRVLRCSPLRRGLWLSSCVKSVALSSAQS